MRRQLTPATSLENLRTEAKRWLKALRAQQPEAVVRLRQAYPKAPAAPVLRDVQHALAREFGLTGWQELTRALAGNPTGPVTEPLRPAEAYHQAAADFVQAFDGDEAALQRLNVHYGRGFSLADIRAEAWRRVYALRQRSSNVPKNYLALEEAQVVVAQDAGFGGFPALLDAIASGAPPSVDAYALDLRDRRIAPRRRLSSGEWSRFADAMRDHQVTALDGGGLVTDDVLARVAALPHVTRLQLGGSIELSDAGLLHLARMPQLESLDLSGYPGGKLTDRGLEVLRHLPNLKHFEMTWQAGVTDQGLAHLRHCDQLEVVNVMGSPTGDGVIEALQGKLRLRQFSTGRNVTDAGLPLLHNFPLLRRWRGERNAAKLLIDGPFTGAGLAGLAGLEGVADLDLFWHVSALTPAGMAHLAALPNLHTLGCDGALSGDEAMPHIAAIPRLRNLRAQESTATDAGFEALSRSRTLEGLWGRVCPGFGSRGFRAFARMPSLCRLGIGLANVDDAALAALPDFPALRELTPIGLQDDGFRHVGRCRNLERLTCMYCRDTTDAATEHIAGLAIRYYYAGLTKITDRSLEILAGIRALQQVDLYECLHVTDAGLVHLAKLPKLKEFHADGSPGITLAGTRVFPKRVRVSYTT